MTEPSPATSTWRRSSLYVFWLFFAGLIYYLQPREHARGLPARGRSTASRDAGAGPVPAAAAQDLPAAARPRRGHRRRTPAPRAADRGAARRNCVRTAPAGADRRPDGRRRRPGRLGRSRATCPTSTWQGPRRRSCRCAPPHHFHRLGAGRDPRGMPVSARRRRGRRHASPTSGSTAPEQLVRYLEVELDGGAGKRAGARCRCARIDAATGSSCARSSAQQFAGVPRTKIAQPGHPARGREDLRLLRRRHALRTPSAPEPLMGASDAADDVQVEPVRGLPELLPAGRAHPLAGRAGLAGAGRSRRCTCGWVAGYFAPARGLARRRDRPATGRWALGLKATVPYLAHGRWSPCAHPRR